jgi:hypothetical protein
LGNLKFFTNTLGTSINTIFSNPNAYFGLKEKNMQLFRVLLILFLLTALEAKSVKWQKLKSLKEYAPSAYSLKKGVEYLEIRAYYKDIGESSYDTSSYEALLSIYRKPLVSFDSKIVKKFKSTQPNLSKETNIKQNTMCLMQGCVSRISNAFMIDSQGKVWRMNRVEDIVSMLGEIDTPSEAKIVLWLNEKHRDIADTNHKDKYRKTSKGYRVLSEYDNSIMNLGECGNFTYRIDINKKGKITQKKLLKTRPSKDGCLTAD